MRSRLPMLAVSVFTGLCVAASAAGARVVGTVKAVHADHVIVQTKERGTLSVGLRGDTKYLKAGGEASAAEVTVGARVAIETVPSGFIAVVIRILKSGKPAGAK